MSERMIVAAEGSRLTLADGPLEAIVEIDGSPGAVDAGHRAAILRFSTLLDEISLEAAALAAPAAADATVLTGAACRRMWRGIRGFAASREVAPILAIDGAVAEELLAAITTAVKPDRVAIRAGQATALLLSPGFGFRSMVAEASEPDGVPVAVEIRAPDPIRGLAIAGWEKPRGSAGIADAVAVVAQTATRAAAAAALIADATDLPGHPAIARSGPAEGDDPADRALTVGVGQLDRGDIDSALAAGLVVAEEMVAAQLIGGATLTLKGRIVRCGFVPAAPLGDAAPARRAGGRR